jgi:hypothetical protein
VPANNGTPRAVPVIRWIFGVWHHPAAP